MNATSLRSTWNVPGFSVSIQVRSSQDRIRRKSSTLFVNFTRILNKLREDELRSSAAPYRRYGVTESRQSDLQNDAGGSSSRIRAMWRSRRYLHTSRSFHSRKSRFRFCQVSLGYFNVTTVIDTFSDSTACAPCTRHARAVTRNFGVTRRRYFYVRGPLFSCAILCYLLSCEIFVAPWSTFNVLSTLPLFSGA